MRTSWRRRYLWDRGLLYERRPEADGQERDRPGGEAAPAAASLPVSPLQLYQEARECLTLLSQRLGSQKFFFGDA